MVGNLTLQDTELANEQPQGAWSFEPLVGWRKCQRTMLPKRAAPPCSTPFEANPAPTPLSLSAFANPTEPPENLDALHAMGASGFATRIDKRNTTISSSVLVKPCTPGIYAPATAMTKVETVFGGRLVSAGFGSGSLPGSRYGPRNNIMHLASFTGSSWRAVTVLILLNGLKGHHRRRVRAWD
ncbi:uncharacterized protein PHACADRAFT_213644 [Phanerochaete carnosa HHB-10118-sp]|uniref:Uncharacterized protein n=1 Tax=Phanerochaete carnosa (strain HHB-10118-sp) TaxID=650164 RepID=K5WKG8_PHACS|nr:uncharacterized protein PHACADRAFT_213644 [Phanerochaete carnosa HHB-10118-sp]EKM50757.1 hypothetical protein PHACADRAFT_213644 [Phanerochaete carnosa HHB-10118-sp]